MSTRPGPLAKLVLFLCAGTAVSALRAAEIVHADGRRETVQALRADGKGGFTIEREGRRVPLAPGEIVVVIDDEGVETVTIPELSAGEDSPETKTLIDSLVDPKNEQWPMLVEQLGRVPTRSKLDALAALAKDPKKEVRQRAVRGLAGLRTRESTLAAVEAVLAEKDATARADGAYALFAVSEIFARCDTGDAVARGLADKNTHVRYVFAMLAAPDDEAAKAVLRGKDGLGSSDHHVRESAATELGERGDAAGENVLVAMLSRNKLPGIDDPALMERLLIEEQVRVCAILGKLGTKAGRSALEKAAKSKRDAVAEAARRALGAP